MRQTIGTGTGPTASANAINREAGDTSTDYAPAFLRALGHLIEAAGLDKLDEAFLYSEAIDVTTYSRQRDKLREELTLAKIDHHTEAVDELDVEGILAFAERILPRASELRVQASLDYKQRLQELFFPEGIAYDGHRFNRTAATAPLFNYLAPSESADEKMVSQNFTSWNQIASWLRAFAALRDAAQRYEPRRSTTEDGDGS